MKSYNIFEFVISYGNLKFFEYFSLLFLTFIILAASFVAEHTFADWPTVVEGSSFVAVLAVVVSSLGPLWERSSMTLSKRKCRHRCRCKLPLVLTHRGE